MNVTRRQLDRATSPIGAEPLYFVYILSQMGRSMFERPRQGSRQYYTGVTTNVKRRLIQHNSGLTKATRGIEWELVAHMGPFPKAQAFLIEKYLKCGDTLKKRAEFYDFVDRIKTEEIHPSHYWATVYPRFRNLAWFNREVV